MAFQPSLFVSSFCDRSVLNSAKLTACLVIPEMFLIEQRSRVGFTCLDYRRFAKVHQQWVLKAIVKGFPVPRSIYQWFKHDVQVVVRPVLSMQVSKEAQAT